MTHTPDPYYSKLARGNKSTLAKSRAAMSKDMPKEASTQFKMFLIAVAAFITVASLHYIL